MSQLSGRNMIVVGASRGLGRGMATALAEAGASVVAVSRTAAEFPQPTNGAGTVQPELADAGDATVAASLIDRYEPEVIVLAAGAIPHMRPLQYQTWETFSVNWQTDVRIAFHWLREALLTVLPQFAPLTDVGRTAVHAYAARAGLSVQDFLRTQAFPLLTPEIAGSAMVKLAQLDAADVSPAYVLNGGGLHKLP